LAIFNENLPINIGINAGYPGSVTVGLIDAKGHCPEHLGSLKLGVLFGDGSEGIHDFSRLVAGRMLEHP
jgi:hypothetical protein